MEESNIFQVRLRVHAESGNCSMEGSLLEERSVGVRQSAGQAQFELGLSSETKDQKPLPKKLQTTWVESLRGEQSTRGKGAPRERMERRLGGKT